MHDPFFVGGSETLNDLVAVIERSVFRNRTAGEPLSQRAAFEQFRDEVRRPLLFADGVDCQHIRVVQHAGRPRLLLEAAQTVRIA